MLGDTEEISAWCFSRTAATGKASFIAYNEVETIAAQTQVRPQVPRSTFALEGCH